MKEIKKVYIKPTGGDNGLRDEIGIIMKQRRNMLPKTPCSLECILPCAISS